jgi:DNA phosphorothioation-dependent restriction protein DptG
MDWFCTNKLHAEFQNNSSSVAYEHRAYSEGVNILDFAFSNFAEFFLSQWFTQILKILCSAPKWYMQNLTKLLSLLRRPPRRLPHIFLFVQN